MPQFARPDADLHVGNWQDEGGATASLFESIDESTASDADYIESELNPSSSPMVVSLGTLTDPLSSSGHTVRYRYAKDTSGGAQIDLDVELREAYASEASQGTLIASWSHTNISDTVTEAEQTLSTGEADSITDYSDLSLRFVATQI